MKKIAQLTGRIFLQARLCDSRSRIFLVGELVVPIVEPRRGNVALELELVMLVVIELYC